MISLANNLLYCGVSSFSYYSTESTSHPLAILPSGYKDSTDTHETECNPFLALARESPNFQHFSCSVANNLKNLAIITLVPRIGL